MRALLCLTAAVLLGAVPAAATESDVLLEAEGNLQVGTAGVGVGAPGQAVPAEAPLGLGPVSHAARGFTVGCERGLFATVTWTSLTNRTADAPEHTLLQIEIRTANGTVLASTFGDDGHEDVGTDGTVDPGSYELHLFHMAGEPLSYEAVVKGIGSTHC